MTVTRNGPFSTESTISQTAGGAPTGRSVCIELGQPGRQLGSDALGRADDRAAPRASLLTRPAKASLAWTIRPRRSDTTTRWAIESKVFSSSRRERMHIVEQLHVLDRARQLPAELVGAIEQIELAAGFDPHTFEDDGVPSARRQPRSGTVTVLVDVVEVVRPGQQLRARAGAWPPRPAHRRSSVLIRCAARPRDPRSDDAWSMRWRARRS